MYFSICIVLKDLISAARQFVTRHYQRRKRIWAVIRVEAVLYIPSINRRSQNRTRWECRPWKFIFKRPILTVVILQMKGYCQYNYGTAVDISTHSFMPDFKRFIVKLVVFIHDQSIKNLMINPDNNTSHWKRIVCGVS